MGGPQYDREILYHNRSPEKSPKTKRIAPLIGFFEILIWLLAISRIFQDLDNWIAYLAYAGGFAAGNYFGMLLEERLATNHLCTGMVKPSEKASRYQYYI